MQHNENSSNFNFFQHDQSLKIFYDFIDLLETSQNSKSEFVTKLIKLFAFLKNNPDLLRSVLKEWHSSNEIKIENLKQINKDKIEFKKDKAKCWIRFGTKYLPLSSSFIRTTLLHSQCGFSHLQVDSFVPDETTLFDDGQIYLCPKDDNGFILYWKNNKELCQREFQESEFKNIEIITESIRRCYSDTTKEYYEIFKNKELLEEISLKLFPSKETENKGIDTEINNLNIFLTRVEEGLQHLLQINKEFPQMSKSLMDSFFKELALIDGWNINVLAAKAAFNSILKHKQDFDSYAQLRHKQILVAGVSLSYTRNELSALIDNLSTIYQHAIGLMGEEVVVIVILQEYALTHAAIPNEDKKSILKLLEEKIKDYKNLILIPGSFLTYKKLSNSSNPEEKAKKIIRNYEENVKNLPTSWQANYLENTKLLHDADALQKVFCLQNCSYIFTHYDKRMKHRKTLPSENRILPLMVRQNPVFNPGSDNKIKRITINNRTLEIGLTICFEHNFAPVKAITDNPPLIETIVSASIDLKKEHLFGALNIHMDSQSGLSIHINNQHPKKTMLGEVRAFYYYFLYDKNIENMKSKEIEIKYFNATESVTPPRSFI